MPQINKYYKSISNITNSKYQIICLFVMFVICLFAYSRAKHEGYPGLPRLSAGYPRPKGRFLRVTHPSAANATANIQPPTFSFLEKPPNCLITLSHISIASL